MNGECENCGRVTEIECFYKTSTGQEIYLCETCSEIMSEEEMQELANCY
jgi:hypothetical protein